MHRASTQRAGACVGEAGQREGGRGQGRYWPVLSLGLLGLVLAGVVQLDLPGRIAYAMERGRLQAIREHLATVESISQVYREVAAVTRPSVVAIRVERAGLGASGGANENPLLRELLRQRRRAPVDGFGSGVIIDAAGYIVTNHHVVDLASNITVRLYDGRNVAAELVGSDPQTDLALLRVQADRLMAMPLGDSSRLGVGDRVLAIGNPFNLDSTVTEGIISALGRSNVGVLSRSDGYENFIQTDAAINPGNSGGALVNIRGELIGINTAIATQTGAYNGIGFAIPVDLVRSVVQQLREGGTVRRGWLGVSILDATPDNLEMLLAEQNGRRPEWLSESAAQRWREGRLAGVMVTEVHEGTPARRAGLAAGDLVTGIGAQRIKTIGSLRATIASARPGTTLNFSILRGDAELELPITLDQQPENLASLMRRAPRSASESESGAPPASATPSPDRGSEAAPEEAEVSIPALGLLGIEVSPASAELVQRFGLRDGRGLVLTRVEQRSPADLAGMVTGMVLLTVNGRPVNTMGELASAIEAAGRQPVILQLRNRDGQVDSYRMRLR